jgi:hypothetical protein
MNLGSMLGECVRNRFIDAHRCPSGTKLALAFVAERGGVKLTGLA